MTVTVVLAAGASRRLGRPKQLEKIGSETLLARAVRVANEAALGPVYVVVRGDDGAVVAEARRLRCAVVCNDEADEGMASSIRAGVRAVGDTAEGVLVMTCDQPAVSAQHLGRLVAEAGGNVIASVYEERRGVPAWFPQRVFPQLLELRGDAGARELLRDAHAVALPDGAIDVDTDEELQRARALFKDSTG